MRKRPSFSLRDLLSYRILVIHLCWFMALFKSYICHFSCCRRPKNKWNIHYWYQVIYLWSHLMRIIFWLWLRYIDTNNLIFFFSPQIVKHAYSIINSNIAVYFFRYVCSVFCPSIVILSKVANDCFHSIDRFHFHKLVLSVFCVFRII